MFIRISNISFIRANVLLCLASLFLLNAIPVFAKKQLTIAAIGQSGEISSAYRTLSAKFNQQIQDDVEIKFLMKPDALFKQTLGDVLRDNHMVDIVIWHAGERLKKYIELGLVLPISDIWQQPSLKNNYSAAIRKAVTYHQQQFALPFSYYLWGMYYKKSLVKRLKLTPPTSWAEFEQTLAIFKQNNITPIFIGTRNLWPVGIWFEYLNLRLNGFDYHEQFLKGQISAHDKGIQQLLKKWQMMIEKGYFFKEHHNKTLAHGVPYIYREQVGLMLAGNVIESQLPSLVINDLSLFPFPAINNNRQNIQVTPLDIMFISSNSQQVELAKKFLLFMANADIQQQHNQTIHQIPVNTKAQLTKSEIERQTIKTLNNAEKLTLFFDREIDEQFGKDNMQIWREFLDNPDLHATTNKMEQVRLKFLNHQNKINTLKVKR